MYAHRPVSVQSSAAPSTFHDHLHLFVRTIQLKIIAYI